MFEAEPDVVGPAPVEVVEGVLGGLAAVLGAEITPEAFRCHGLEQGLFVTEMVVDGRGGDSGRLVHVQRSSAPRGAGGGRRW